MEMCTIMPAAKSILHFLFLFGTDSQSLHSSIRFYVLVPTEMEIFFFLKQYQFSLQYKQAFCLKIRAGLSMTSEAMQPCHAMRSLLVLIGAPCIVQCYVYCSHTGALIITLQQGTLCWLHLLLTASFLPALKINKPKVSSSCRKHRRGI